VDAVATLHPLMTCPLPGATCGDALKIIPRIFRERRPTVAHGGIQPHTLETINGA